MFVKMIMAPRLVRVDTERIADWKLSSIHLSPWKRIWKYGAAAMNMFLFYRARVSSSRYIISLSIVVLAYHAHNIATPSRASASAAKEGAVTVFGKERRD